MSYKRNAGFTLVELMVVMAIIAILATAGISQYGKFLKSARDTTRLGDLQAINVVILDSIQSTGLVPADITELTDQMEETAGKVIVDKIDWKACLDKDKVAADCGYYYASCDGSTGYVIATAFEAPGNVAKYAKDDLGGTYAGDQNKYEIGTCNDASITLSKITAS